MRVPRLPTLVGDLKMYTRVVPPTIAVIGDTSGCTRYPEMHYAPSERLPVSPSPTSLSGTQELLNVLR